MALRLVVGKRRGRSHGWIVLFALAAQFLWLSACISRDRAAGAAYLNAQTAFRKGDFNPSLAMARDGLRRWPEGDWGWRFRTVGAEDLIYLGQAKDAGALLEPPGSPSDASLRARLKLGRARVALQLRSGNGLNLLRAALQDALAAGDRSLVCMVRLRLGDYFAGSSDGEAYLRAALADAEQEHDPYLVTWARLNFGYHLAKASRFDEAVPFLAAAEQGARQYGAKSMLAASLGNLGWCNVMLGDLDRAQNFLSRAEALSAQIGARDFQQRWLGALGMVHLRRGGDLDLAAGYEQRAARLAQEVGSPAWQAIAFSNLALTSLYREDPVAAQSYNDQALAIERRLGDELSTVYSGYNAAQIELLARRYERAKQGYQKVIEQAPRVHASDLLWQGYNGLAAVYRRTGRPALADAQFRNAIDTIDREWAKLNSDDWKTTFLAPDNLISFFQEYVDFLIERGQTDKALEVAESSRARVLNQRLRHLGQVSPNFHIAKLLSAARASHTVILSYWLAPNRSSVWVIGPGRPSHHFLPSSKEIAGLVEQYTHIVTQGGDPLTQNDALASALYEAVLGPVHKLIPPGSNVIVVPDGALHQLAFGTLVAPGPPPHYWIEDVALATAPSLRALQTDRPRRAATPKLLLMGDPVLVGRDFPPLANIRNEIAAVEEQFAAPNRTVLTGAGAVPAEYAKASPASFTNIHFATHGTANLQSPLNSAIILSHQGENYKLYARDVAVLPLTAELVTISTCKSAGAKAYSGEGLMGFAWAFLQAGSRNVIATLWDEDDSVSPELMRVLYAEMGKGQTPAGALRASKLALMRRQGAYRLPYYWGPLQVFTREIAGGPAAQH